MRTSKISYHDGSSELEAFVAHSTEEKRPAVILCHAWRGKDTFICEKAELIAQWGYVGFALDMYGKEILGNSKEENVALKKPFVENRELLQKRVLKGFEAAAKLPFVDASRVVALGFGFGGMCALDLARNTNLTGVISVYGHLNSPTQAPIKSKVLILHGAEDKIVGENELHDFEKQMKESKTDWQLHVFGEAMHAFATPGANDPQAGILYNPTAAARSWVMIRQFLDELLR